MEQNLMIITYKGLQLNGQNPTMLYGYGGFNVSLTPGFSIANAVCRSGTKTHKDTTTSCHGN
jgi:prolyl oligopeptidase PreP (S9A serine peptidase family)